MLEVNELGTQVISRFVVCDIWAMSHGNFVAINCFFGAIQELCNCFSSSEKTLFIL